MKAKSGFAVTFLNVFQQYKRAILEKYTLKTCEESR